MTDVEVVAVIRDLLAAGPPLKTLPPTIFRHTTHVFPARTEVWVDEAFVLDSDVDTWAAVCKARFEAVGGDGFALCFIAEDAEADAAHGEFHPGQDSDFILICVHRAGGHLRSFKTPLTEFIAGRLGDEVDMREFLPELGHDDYVTH